MPCSVEPGAKTHVLDPVAAVIEQHVFHFLEFTVHRVAVEGLHSQRLAIGILLARNLEFLFLGGETLDDLLLSDVFRRRGIKLALSALGRSERRQGSVVSRASARKCRSDRGEVIEVPAIIVFDESRRKGDSCSAARCEQHYQNPRIGCLLPGAHPALADARSAAFGAK